MTTNSRPSLRRPRRRHISIRDSERCPLSGIHDLQRRRLDLIPYEAARFDIVVTFHLHTIHARRALCCRVVGPTTTNFKRIIVVVFVAV